MGSERDPMERDSAVRTMLVRRVAEPDALPTGSARLRVGIVTSVVLVVVVALSVLAIRVGGGRVDAPVGEASRTPLPTASPPAGVPLGRYTSDDGPKQTHTIHPNGLAISTTFACRGVGDWSIRIPHEFDSAAVSPPGRPPGRCDGVSGSTGNKGESGAARLIIDSAPTTRWTLTVIGIPETYVTPTPIPTPTDGSGVAVRSCAAEDLSARLERVAMPKGVTRADGGQIELTNRSGTRCALVGYPMVRFVDDAGSILGHHTMAAVDDHDISGKGMRAVLLVPGGSAYTQIDWYLPNYYVPNEEGPCERRVVHTLRIDLANRFAGPAQRGSLTLPAGGVTACLNGAHGTDGKYGQISATQFVDYSEATRK